MKRPLSTGASRGLAVACLLALACVPGCARSATTSSSTEASADWNESQVAWRPYHAGLEEARAAGKPVVLIFFTDWCPHCHNYSRLFHDPEVVKLAASFVMIRVERDSHPDISARHAPDGEYIPRTFFLRPNGELLPVMASGRDQYRYYLDEHDPGELVSLMKKALARLGVSSAEPE